MIVLVSDADWEDHELARQIWELASARRSRVLLLGMVSHPTEESRLWRHLVTLAAVIKDGDVSTEIRIEAGSNWLRAIGEVLEVGDLIVCRDGHRTGLRHRPLSELLTYSFQAPVYVLPGLPASDRARSSLLLQTVSWGGMTVILVGFFWVQLHIQRNTENGAQTTLLVLSVVIEMALLWIWNSLSA